MAQLCHKDGTSVPLGWHGCATPMESSGTVICLISGGNIDVNILSRVIGRGLQKSGRSCSMTIELVDKPGQLQHVSEIIASTGANVVSVYHERVSHTADINGCYLRLEMETRNQQQINEIRQLLTVSGYKIVEG